MSKLIHGSCYCQKIMFIVKDEFSRFYFCHCDQCRKMMGTAHAANLFTEVDNLTWLKGAELVKLYDDPHRAFTKAFCPEWVHRYHTYPKPVTPWWCQRDVWMKSHQNKWMPNCFVSSSLIGIRSG